MKKYLFVLFFISLLSVGITTVEAADYQEPFDMENPPIGREIEQPYIHGQEGGIELPDGSILHGEAIIYPAGSYEGGLFNSEKSSNPIPFEEEKEGIAKNEEGHFRRYLEMCGIWIQSLWKLFFNQNKGKLPTASFFCSNHGEMLTEKSLVEY